MWTWVKTACVLALLVIPGGFVLLLTYVWAKAIRRASERARAMAPGTTIRLRDVLAELSFQDLVREARTAL